MYLFDTNLISELRRPARMAPLAARWADGVPQDAVFVSVITLFEIELGIRRIERREPDRAGQLWRWLAADVIGRHADRIIAVDEPIARAAAALHVPDPRPLAPPTAGRRVHRRNCGRAGAYRSDAQRPRFRRHRSGRFRPVERRTIIIPPAGPYRRLARRARLAPP